MKSTFQIVRDYLINLGTGSGVTRQMILGHLIYLKKENLIPGFSESYVDTIRNQYRGAGYLETLAPGQYKIVMDIPTDLTSSQLHKEYNQFK